MALSDALAVDGTLKPWSPNKTLSELRSEQWFMVTSSDPSCDGCLRFEAQFWDGRLYAIRANAWGLSPVDATAFQNNTLAMLGSADTVVRNEFDETILVWSDGDIRLQLDNSILGAAQCHSAPRTVSLTATVWPVMRHAIVEDKRARQEDRDVFLQRELIRWADPSAPTVVTKQLPRSLRGLALRMRPWEVRSAAPGIDLRKVSAAILVGSLAYADSSELRVQLWNGEVSRIYLGMESPSNEVFQDWWNTLVDGRLGTPFEQLNRNSVDWRSDGISLSVVIMCDGMCDGTSKDRSLKFWLVDRQLDRQKDERECAVHPTIYKFNSPDPRSFF